MGDWVLFQLPADMPLAMLEGVKLNLEAKGVQSAGSVDALVNASTSEHILPLKEKKGKLKVAGKLIRSVQIVKGSKRSKKASH